MILENRNIVSIIKRSKVTDYAALKGHNDLLHYKCILLHDYPPCLNVYGIYEYEVALIKFLKNKQYLTI